MKRIYFLLLFLGSFFHLPEALAQNIHYRNLQQFSPMIKVELHHNETSGLGLQHAGVTIQNLTGNKLRVELEYYADLYCGKKVSAKIGFGSGVVIKPNERFGGDGFFESQNEAFNAAYKAGDDCKAVKIAEGKYSKIKSMSYRLISVENLTEKERQQALAAERAAEEKKAAAEKLAAERKAAADKLAAERKAAADKATAEREAAAKKAEEDRARAAAANKAKAAATAAANQSSGNSSSGSSPGSSSGNTATKSTASNTTNAPKPRPDLPDNFRTTDGKFYLKDSNGVPYEVSNSQYDSFRKERAAARQPAPTPQKSDAEILAETQAKLQKQTDDYFNSVKESQEKFARQSQRYANNAQDREVLNAVKENVEDLSNLRGVYETVEELNRDFNQQYHSINSSISELTEARNREWNSRVDASFAEGDANTQLIGESAKLIGNIVNSANEEKERKAYQEQLRQQRAAHERQIVERKRQMILGFRNDLITKFKEGHIPLSSQKIKADRLFYFVYAYDKASINQDRPEMYVSNVFEIGRYGDGTWPFKSSISNEIQSLTPYPETMHGYYKTQEEAEEMQEAFKQLLVKSEVSIKPVTFKGKKSTVTASNGSTDFWGNENKTAGQQAIQSQNVNQSQTPELDFWGNPVKKPEPVPVPKTEVMAESEIEYSPETEPAAAPVAPQPEPVKKQPTELDFWGNPVK